MALDAIRLLDHLAIDKAHVVGYSLGGIIAAKLLTTHPTLRERAPRRRGVPPLAQRRSDREADAAAREIEAGVYRALLVSTAPTDEPSLKEEDIRARSAEIAGGTISARSPRLCAHGALVVSDAEIATVRVPSLAVVGAADRRPASRPCRAFGPASRWSCFPARRIRPCIRAVCRATPPFAKRSAGTLHARNTVPI